MLSLIIPPEPGWLGRFLADPRMSVAKTWRRLLKLLRGARR